MVAMILWYLLLMALVQEATTESPEVPAALDVELPGVSVERVPLTELKDRIIADDFVPVPFSQLKALLLRDRSGAPAAGARPGIREARYEAHLNGTQLNPGRLEFDIYPESRTSDSGPLLIGQTNLQQLKISDPQGLVELGSDSARRLFLLTPGCPEQLTGTWNSDGMVAGDVVSFRLELPAATTTRFDLLTSPRIRVTSVGNLILGPDAVASPESGDELYKWTILPGDTARLTFSCREQPLLQSQDPLPLAGFKSSHVLSGDILNSRWTIGLPSELNGRARLTARLSSRIRVADVQLEDKRPVEWQVKDENGQMQLHLVLPENSESALLNISAASVLPQTETWDLPMLTPIQWSSKDGELRGPILVPIGQISVILPGAVDLDEWTLVGIQERDIVTSPDQSREYQLTQFLPEASAIARTSTSEPRLSDSVATLVEPAGRLATVRCLVNVQCEGAAVVELQWPVSNGWQVIAARYASNSRALFFEFPQADPEAATSPLTLHLPESLEPGASRVVEIQFRQSDATDTRNLSLPLGENKRIVRNNAIVVFPSAMSLNPGLQRRWSAGRRTLTVEEVRVLMSWLPESRLASGSLVYTIGGGDSAGLAGAAVEPLRHDSIELEHAVRIVEGQIVETTRIVIPIDDTTGESLSFSTPIESSNDLRWSIDGEAVPARRESSEDDSRDWRRWSLNLAGRRAAGSVAVRCEARQSASQQFVATIPKPNSDLPIHGTLRLYSSDEGQITASGLKLSEATAVEPGAHQSQATSWELSSTSDTVTLVLGHNPKIQFGQTIDVHMLHMIDEHSGGVNQQVLAVANVSRSAGQNSLPVELSDGIRPLVLVNGHRVHLQETSSGHAIPLPLTSADCQVLLIWTESALSPDNVTGDRELPRLFLRELSVPQCTHHLLVSPELDLRAPATSFAATDSADVMRILNRLLSESASPDETSGLKSGATVPSEIRSFISYWQLAISNGWQQCTLIDTVHSDLPIRIEVTQLRRRLAIAVGVVLLIIAGCIAFRDQVHEFRLPLGLIACALRGVSFLMTVSIVEAIFTGAFWGLICGVAVVTFSRWSWLRDFRFSSMLRSVGTIMIAMTIVSDACGQQPTDTGSLRADSSPLFQAPEMLKVLLPETPLPDSDVAYVPRAVLEKWRKKTSAGKDDAFAAVIKSLQTEVVAESADSVELLLRMEVAAVSGDELCNLRIPLQGSRLVSCTIDGNQILPEPDGPDAILIPVPASALVPARSRENLANAIRGADEGTKAREDENGTDSREATGSVDAGPLAAFTLHQIECRLRPLTVRQKSGLQFRLPALPCPVAELKVTAPELFTRVRAQSSAGVLQFRPEDGTMQLNSLAMSEGIDIRLFQSGIDKGSPQLATLEMLMIAELVAEQPVISCFCRFSRWNPLTPELRYRIPQGYQLVSVNSVNGGDLLWSTENRIASILLPNNFGNEFVVSLQLKSTSSSPLQQRLIPIVELGQFFDCVVSPNLLLAVRVNPVFSVLPVEGQQVKTLAYADTQAAWGQWLRRSDSIFGVPSGLPEAIVRLTARQSLNEVRVTQNYTLQNQRVDWKCQFDIDTSVLPVFRHRLTISSDVEITEVQAGAGESNRLSSWHRRGDRLVIQLREGTTGRHTVKIVGRKLLRPDDTQIALNSPHLENAQILESVLELIDQDGLGLAFEKLGGAVPTQPIALNDPLQPGVTVRMQIVDESNPIVLQRLRPVEPEGAVAVLRFSDHISVAVRLTQWSGSLGPLSMRFPDGTEFLATPSVLIDGRQLPLIQEDFEFVAGPDVIRELFDQPEFTIVWSMPRPEIVPKQTSIAFAWPEISDRIQWTQRLLIPLESSSGIGRTDESSVDLPAWLQNSSVVGFGQELPASKTRAIGDGVQVSSAEMLLTIPVNSGNDIPNPDPLRKLFACSSSAVWSNPNQSAVGQTTLVIFAARPSVRCSLIIPEGIVVTELETAEAIRWEDAERERVTIELTSQVTVIKIRWMSKRAESGFASSTLQFTVPFPAECETLRLVTVASSEGELPQFQKDMQTVSSANLESLTREDLVTCSKRLEPDASSTTVSTELLPDADSLLEILNSSRQEFIAGFVKVFSSSIATTTCRPVDNASIRVFSRKRLQWPTVVSIAAGFLTVAGAAFGHTMRSSVSDQATRIATQSLDSRQSGSRPQTSGVGQPPAVESASEGKAGPQQS